MGDWLGPDEHDISTVAAAIPQHIIRMETRVEFLAFGIWSPV